MLALGACGGGSDSGSSTPAVQVYDVPALVKTDTVVGTGAEATASSIVTIKYTGWLYNTTKPENKGTQFDSNTITTPLSGLITGWIQGVPGMKVGGKRTLLIPSSLGYGAGGNGIPGNSALLFEMELIAVK
jgi:FKBP-type peptidyl-prolyl cis-trans isomerase FkpA